MIIIIISFIDFLKEGTLNDIIYYLGNVIPGINHILNH